MSGTSSGLIAILMWSIGTTMVFLTGNTSPFILGFLSFGISGVSLLIFNLHQKNDLRILKSIFWCDYILAFSGIFFYTIFLYISFRAINPLEANILNYLWPVLLGFLMSLGKGFRGAFLPIMGLIVGFIGLYLLFYNGSAIIEFKNIQWGHFFAFLASIVWAVYSWLAQKRDYQQIIFVPILLIGATFCLLIEYLFFDPIWPSGLEWFFVFILGFLRLSYVFWDHGVRYGNALLLSSLSYFIPVISFFLIYFAGAKVNSPYLYASVFLITMGCLLSNSAKIKEWFKK